MNRQLALDPNTIERRSIFATELLLEAIRSLDAALRTRIRVMIDTHPSPILTDVDVAREVFHRLFESVRQHAPTDSPIHVGCQRTSSYVRFWIQGDDQALDPSVHELVRRLDGTLSVSSSPTLGQTICVDLPLATNTGTSSTPTSTAVGGEYSISYETSGPKPPQHPSLRIVHQLKPREHAPDRNSLLEIECACLSDAERKAVCLVAQGMTDREIAQAIYVSTRSVQNYLNRARTKLGLRGRAQIACWAADHNLVS